MNDTLFVRYLSDSFAVTATIALLVFAIPACALLTPKRVHAGLELAACVADHVELPPAQIVVLCGAENTQDVVDLISKMKEAQARAAKTGACRDAGAD